MLNWFDVETTGLDYKMGHLLLEVGCIITDDRLVEVARHSMLIDTGVSVGDLRLIANPLVRDMHGKSGLWRDLLAAKTGTGEFKILGEVEDVFLALVREHSGGKSRGLLAGNSVHFDRTWLHKFMPNLEMEFHHRNFDVSTLSEAHCRFCPDAVPFPKTGDAVHRVIVDLEHSIAELRYYLDLMGWDDVLS